MRRSISIIIPAYNEEQRLPDTMQKVREYLGRSAWEFAEIVVVDDGSRDGTAEAARAAGARVLENPGNRGKGYTVRHGMLEAKGEWALFTDADLSAPIEELDKLWSAAAREQAQVAIGSRAVDRSLIGVHQPFFREAMGRFFNLVMRLITGLPFQRHAVRIQAVRSARGAGDLRAAAAGGVRVRRRSAVHRPAAGLPRRGSAGAMERRGGHQGEPVARA